MAVRGGEEWRREARSEGAVSSHKGGMGFPSFNPRPPQTQGGHTRETQGSPLPAMWSQGL